MKARGTWQWGVHSPPPGTPDPAQRAPAQPLGPSDTPGASAAATAVHPAWGSLLHLGPPPRPDTPVRHARCRPCSEPALPSPGPPASPGSAARDRATLTVNVQHHFPKRRSDGLMEAKPHLSAPAQGVGAALRRGEEGAAHRGVPGARDPVWAAAVRPRPPRGLAGRPASGPRSRRTPRRPRPRGTRRDAACGTDWGTHGLDAGQRETPQRGTQGGGAESLPARARSPSPRRLTAPRGDGRRGSVGREPEATCAKQARPPVPGHRDAAPRRAPGRRRVIKVAPTPSRWWPCRPAGAHGPSHSPDLTDPASFPVISQTENRLPS